MALSSADASLQQQERQGDIEVFIGAADGFGCTIAAMHYDNDTIAELTMIIAWENASSRFNRAFRIPSQGFWRH